MFSHGPDTLSQLPVWFEVLATRVIPVLSVLIHIKAVDDRKSGNQLRRSFPHLIRGIIFVFL